VREIKCLIIDQTEDCRNKLINLVENDERCLLLQAVSNAESIEVFQSDNIPDLLLAGYECCNSTLVDLIQHYSRHIQIVFVVNLKEYKQLSIENFPFLVIEDNIDLDKWEEIVKGVLKYLSMIESLRNVPSIVNDKHRDGLF
jgi:hypothetical protein